MTTGEAIASTDDDQETIDPQNQVLANNPEYKILGEKLVKDHKIRILEFLGRGSYSQVMKGYNIDLNHLIAVKIIDTRVQSEYVRRFLPREIGLVKNLKHSNVLRVHQLSGEKTKNEPKDINHYSIFVTEFCNGGDLLQKIKKSRRIPESESKLIFRQLIEALMMNEIVHRDLKCENVFLDKHENVKLGDFGFARYLRKDERANTFCGSRAYVAPEILRAISYTGQTVDVWSAGVVLYVMITGVMPYDDRHPQKMVERQLGHKIRFPRIDISVQVKTLIYEILHPFPQSRPSYNAICASEWLKNTAYFMRGHNLDKVNISSTDSRSHG